MDLNERKMRILQAIISDFVSSAEPVGSRTLSKKYDMGISPATIRNEMSDLEEMGFLTHPHTSAGRVPSDKAYRLYVDEFMKKYELPEKEKQAISEKLTANVSELDRTLEHAAQLVSEITKLTTFAIPPQEEEKPQLAEPKQEGEPKQEAYVPMYVEGVHNIFSFPEYSSDIDKVRDFIELLSRREYIKEVLVNRDDGVIITIGDENSEVLQDYSLITATYHVDGKLVGRIGVMGPKRMKYDEVTSVLEYITENLTRTFSLPEGDKNGRR